MKSSFTIINTNKLKLSGLLALLLATSVMLTACGGGGGTASMPTTPPTIPAPPTVVVPTTPPTIPAPPMVVVPTTPPAKPAPPTVVVPTTPPAKPVPPMVVVPTIPPPIVTPRQAIEIIVRNPTGINDPYFRSTCVPGAMGVGCYTDSNHNLVNVVDVGRSVYRRGVTAFNRRIEGPRISDPSLWVPNPPRDVRTAWREGWAGRGANILVMDDFQAFGEVGGPAGQDDPRGIHGYAVTMSARQIANRATFYGLEAGLVGDPPRYPGRTTYRQGGLRHRFSNVEVTGSIPNMQVVNMSFSPSPVDPSTTPAEFERELIRRTNNPRFRDVAGIANTPLSQALADAVITKSAGNHGVDSMRSIANAVLISTRIPTTRNRALIVGALDRFARTSTMGENDSVSSQALMASYSSFAGGSPEMQARFLVEYGGSPYEEHSYLCDASRRPSCHNLQLIGDPHTEAGTSFAAPRVAGFAALVRGKFLNLSGEQTAKILLDTATTAGLACHTGSARKSATCAKNIYGQGRVDITGALSPIGKLQ